MYCTLSPYQFGLAHAISPHPENYWLTLITSSKEGLSTLFNEKTYLRCPASRGYLARETPVDHPILCLEKTTFLSINHFFKVPKNGIICKHEHATITNADMLQWFIYVCYLLTLYTQEYCYRTLITRTWLACTAMRGSYGSWNTLYKKFPENKAFQLKLKRFGINDGGEKFLGSNFEHNVQPQPKNLRARRA